jgi:hypothetical protein
MKPHSLLSDLMQKEPMSQPAKPAPFNLGDHVRYVGAQSRDLSAGQEAETELVLVPGMVGVILLSSGAFGDPSAAATRPWHCKVQFQNGFQLDINQENRGDFEMVRDAEVASV